MHLNSSLKKTDTHTYYRPPLGVFALHSLFLYQDTPPPRLPASDWLFLSKTVSCINTYLLTPWCRVFLEKLTRLQLFKKFPAFHGTRRFITALTSVRHLSLSWASPIQSIHPHPTSWRSILILSTHLHLGLPSGLLLSGFPTKTLYNPLSSPTSATCPAHLILLDFITLSPRHGASSGCGQRNGLR